MRRRPRSSTREFGGRHMDVDRRGAATTGCTPECPSGASGGWARELVVGQPVTVGFDPASDAMFYDADGARIAGHVPVEATRRGRSVTPWLSPSHPVAPDCLRVLAVERVAATRRRSSPSSAGIGYLVVLPLFRLQTLAFEDGAARLPRRLRRAAAWPTRSRTTVGLALGSLAIAMVLGTLLAWAATRLPPRLRLLRVAARSCRSSCRRWPIVHRLGVPALAPPRLPQRPAAQPAVVVRTSTRARSTSTRCRGSSSSPGSALTAFVYLFVSAGFAQHQLRADRGGAGRAGHRALGVFFRVTLPLLRPVLVYGGGVALLLGLGQFTGPLLLGPQRRHHGAHDRHVLRRVAVAGRLRRGGGHRLAAAAVRHRRRDRRRRCSSATRAASSPTAARRSGRRAAVEAGRRPASSPTASSRRSCRSSRS